MGSERHSGCQCKFRACSGRSHQESLRRQQPDISANLRSFRYPNVEPSEEAIDSAFVVVESAANICAKAWRSELTWTGLSVHCFLSSSRFANLSCRFMWTSQP